jgi:hypothetical protein
VNETHDDLVDARETLIHNRKLLLAMLVKQDDFRKGTEAAYGKDSRHWPVSSSIPHENLEKAIEEKRDQIKDNQDYIREMRRAGIT